VAAVSSAPEQQPPVVAARGVELPHDLRLGDLGGRQVEGRREVDDDPVHALVLQRAHRVVGVVEHLRLRGRLDLRLRGVEACRADLDAELGLGQLAEAGCIRHGRGLQRDDGLRRGEVGAREVDALRPLRRDRDLVDVEVEVLRPGRVGRVERDDGPLHLVLPEAELLRDRVRDGALEALAVRRLVILEVRRIRGLVGPDRELPALVERQLVVLAARRAGRLRRVRRGAGVRVIAAGRHGEGER
jgi:hypothetical protein